MNRRERRQTVLMRRALKRAKRRHQGDRMIIDQALRDDEIMELAVLEFGDDEDRPIRDFFESLIERLPQILEFIRGLVDLFSENPNEVQLSVSFASSDSLPVAPE